MYTAITIHNELGEKEDMYLTPNQVKKLDRMLKKSNFKITDEISAYINDLIIIYKRYKKVYN